MSTVFRASDQQLGRDVAVKVLAGHSTDVAAVERGRSEIGLLASLNHRALVTLFDADVATIDGEERTFLVMEYVEGPALDARLRLGPLADADLRALVSDIADGLQAVHDRGIVHRDIKPANILLATSAVPGREFTAKLADFGIASLVDATRITATGTIVGTAAYLSPEQAAGRRVGPATDVYALGLVILETLTGERVFPGTMVETLSARLTRDPVVPGSVGTEWRSLLGAMTARDPESRPTAAQVAERLARFDTDSAPTEALPSAGVEALDATLRLAGAEALDATLRLEPARPDAAEAGSGSAASRGRRVSKPVVWVVGIVAAAVLAAVIAFGTTLNDSGRDAGPVEPSPSSSTHPGQSAPGETPASDQEPSPESSPGVPSNPGASSDPAASPSSSPPPTASPTGPVGVSTSGPGDNKPGKGDSGNSGSSHNNGNGNGKDKGSKK